MFREGDTVNISRSWLEENIDPDLLEQYKEVVFMVVAYQVIDGIIYARVVAISHGEALWTKLIHPDNLSLALPATQYKVLNDNTSYGYTTFDAALAKAKQRNAEQPGQKYGVYAEVGYIPVEKGASYVSRRG